MERMTNDSPNPEAAALGRLVDVLMIRCEHCGAEALPLVPVPHYRDCPTLSATGGKDNELG